MTLQAGEKFNPHKKFFGLFIPDPISRNEDLSSTAKLCYGKLCQFAGIKGHCYPSYEKLSKELGRSEKQIYRSIRELEDYGLIIGENPTGTDRYKHFNKTYFFLWHPSLEGYDRLDLNGYSRLDVNVRSKNIDSISLKPISKIKEEPCSSSLSDISTFNETPVESGLNIVGLIKRTVKAPIEFEKFPRQKYNGVAMDIINYWNSSPGLSHNHLPPIINGRVGEPTKIFTQTYETISKVLNGKFFTEVGMSKEDRVYTKEEIITALDRFKLAATHPGFLPADKASLKGLKLAYFFYNPYSNYVPSHFLKCLKDEPKPLTSVIKLEDEVNPQLTKWIEEAYVEKILLGEIRKFSNLEKNKFIAGSNRLHDTMRRLQKRVNMSTQAREWCQMLVDALIASWGRENVHPGHISSDYTYSDTLTRFMKNKGRID